MYLYNAHNNNDKIMPGSELDPPPELWKSKNNIVIFVVVGLLHDVTNDNIKQ